jgi:hypothetical protein
VRCALVVAVGVRLAAPVPAVIEMHRAVARVAVAVGKPVVAIAVLVGARVRRAAVRVGALAVVPALAEAVELRGHVATVVVVALAVLSEKQASTVRAPTQRSGHRSHHFVARALLTKKLS